MLDMPRAAGMNLVSRCAQVTGLLGAVAFALGVGSCASDPGARCVRGVSRPSAPAARDAGTASGSQCVSFEFESVEPMRVNLQLDPHGTAGGGDDDPEAADAAPAAPGTPVTYAAAAAPAGTNWIDICSAPNSRRVLQTVDDRQENIPQPGAPPIAFPVRVYDTVVTPPFTLSSNGWLSFLGGASGPLSGTIPSPSLPNLLVAGYWRDLYTRPNGICYGSTGAAPNRRFVVQWDDLHFCCTNDPAIHMTFEIVIHEVRAPRTNNVIDVIYQRMDGATAPGGAGIENADGTQAAVIQPPFVPRAVRLMPSR